MKSIKTIILIAGLLSCQNISAQLGGLLNKAKNKITQEKKEPENKANNEKSNNTGNSENKGNTEKQTSTTTSQQNNSYKCDYLLQEVYTQLELVVNLRPHSSIIPDFINYDDFSSDYFMEKYDLNFNFLKGKQFRVDQYQVLKNRYDSIKANCPKSAINYENIDKRVLSTDNILRCGDSIALEFATNERYYDEVASRKNLFKVADPKKELGIKIENCDKYIKYLNRFRKDISFTISEKTLQVIESKIKQIEAAKKDHENYTSSGQFDKDEIKALEIELLEVKVPHAPYSDVALENAVKKQALNATFEELEMAGVLKSGETKIKTITKTGIIKADFTIKKDGLGNIIEKYKEVLVVFKDEKNNCWYTAFFPTYTYQGGGKYSNVMTIEKMKYSVRILCNR